MMEKDQDITLQHEVRQEATEVELSGGTSSCGDERPPSSTVPREGERGTGRSVSGEVAVVAIILLLWPAYAQVVAAPVVEWLGKKCDMKEERNLLHKLQHRSRR